MRMAWTRRVLPAVALAWLGALVLAGCSAPDRPPAIVLATTTSVASSGLRETLLPAFETDAGVSVRVHMVGSGLALRFLEQGQADVAISHAPPTEAAFLAANPGWNYRKLMYNDFLVAGPAADPAGVSQSASIEDAMRRIAASSARFVSRGDESGTHAREHELWEAAAVTLIGAFRINGRPAFVVWPNGKPRDTPEALPF